MTKLEEAKAYAAGQAAHSIVWPPDTPAEVRAPGLHHCPFPEGDPQRVPWLQGYSDVFEEAKPPANLLKTIRDEIGVADRVA